MTKTKSFSGNNCSAPKVTRLALPHWNVFFFSSELVGVIFLSKNNLQVWLTQAPAHPLYLGYSIAKTTRWWPSSAIMPPCFMTNKNLFVFIPLLTLNKSHSCDFFLLRLIAEFSCRHQQPTKVGIVGDLCVCRQRGVWVMPKDQQNVGADWQTVSRNRNAKSQRVVHFHWLISIALKM